MAEGTNGTRVKRWSAKRKTEVVLRLLRGEELEAVSREIQVPAPEIEDWRRVFLEGGSRGLNRADRDPTKRELVRTRPKVGELAMKLELAEHLLKQEGVRGRPEEALALEGVVSPATGRRDSMTWICTVLRVPRRSMPGGPKALRRRRGPSGGPRRPIPTRSSSWRSGR